MGCDIHIYVERKENDKWHNCDYFIPSIKGGYERIEIRNAFANLKVSRMMLVTMLKKNTKVGFMTRIHAHI